MHQAGRAATYLAFALAATACSKSEEPPARTEPWPAPAAQRTSATVVERYSVAAESQLMVSLPAREAKLSGRITVVTGDLEVDLSELARTRGKIRVDVGSIEMQVDDDVAATRRQTSEARNWLDLGSAQPEAERERKRWADFVITQVETEDASSAHEGRRQRIPRPRADEPVAAPGASPAPEGAEPAPRPEAREVRLRVRGDLTFHGYRVEHTIRLRARFHYPGPAAPDARPTRIEIDTRSPLKVSLAAHDIKPRDAAGTFVSRGVKLLSAQVAREAQVSMRLVAVPNR